MHQACELEMSCAWPEMSCLAAHHPLLHHSSNAPRTFSKHQADALRMCWTLAQIFSMRV